MFSAHISGYVNRKWGTAAKATLCGLPALSALLCVNKLTYLNFLSISQVFILPVSFHTVNSDEEKHHPEGLGAADDQHGQGEETCPDP